MSKTKKTKYSKRFLSYQEILLRDLQFAVRNILLPQEKKEICNSLIKWYMENHYFTSAQFALAKSITSKLGAERKPAKEKKHYLYAISDGENIKLGMSSNVNNRLKSLQTANPKTLSVIWKYYTGKEIKNARICEKRLHTACKRFKLNGEWFSNDCLEVINQFNPNRSAPKVWSSAKLFTIESRRKGKINYFDVMTITRNELSRNMKRIFSLRDDQMDLHHIEQRKLLEDGFVVFEIYE